MRVGEALKRGGTEKRERGNKDIKKEVGKARSRGGCLKKEGGCAGTSLYTMSKIKGKR